MLTLLLAATGTSVTHAQEGGIEIFAGETLFEQGTRLSISHIYKAKGSLYRGSSEVANPTDRESSEQRLVLGWNYGLRPRVTVGALLPVVDPESRSNTTTLGDSGIGDLAAFGKLRLYTSDSYRRSYNLSLVAGVETPTGRTGLVGPQPGSGSWDPFAAFAFTDSIRRWRFDAQVFYKWNTEGTDSYADSDVFSLGVTAAYRYLHRPYPGVSNNAKLGLLWKEEGRASSHGVADPDSGSHQLILRPGLGFHPIPAIDLSIRVDIPIYQHFEGEQLGLDYRTILAFGYRF